MISKFHPRLLSTAFGLVCLVFLSLGTRSSAQQGNASSPGRGEAWDAETVDLLATLPVQHRGRVKPLESLAGLNLLMINGKRKLKLENGETLRPSAWLMDCFFYPEEAKEYRCIRIENDGVLTALGLDARKKRDWYSYNEIAKAKGKLRALASRSMQKETADRDAVERQTLKLFADLRSFEALVGFLEPLRTSFSTGTSDELREVFGGQEKASMSEVLRQMPQLFRLSAQAQSKGTDNSAIEQLLRDLEAALGTAETGLTLFPPGPKAENPEEWWTLGKVVTESFNFDPGLEQQIELVASWERLEAKKSDRAAFREELGALNVDLVGQAQARGEYKHIPLEVKLNRWDLFTNALVLYLLAFLLLAGTWLAPKLRILRWGAWGAVSSATALVIAGIVVRCIIRQRPPIVTLYDTILFITACVVLVALFIEWVTRQRIGIGVATVLGVIGMFLAGRYELKEVASAGDTMASVVAVLDTNYYLAIHVTTIAMGYAGGLLASGIAHVWILGRFFGYRRGDKAFYKSISRMVYGVVCFSLLFAIFGTIMGGVWANDSWGRFWGWDPKENGALLICIWQLLVLHARMGGFIRDRGLAVMAVLGGVVVSVSWWGVNLLNVGLHSYGFTSGVATLLVAMWAVEAFMLLLSGIDYLRGKGANQSPQAT